jgi:hypothetical protein
MNAHIRVYIILTEIFKRAKFLKVAVISYRIIYPLSKEPFIFYQDGHNTYNNGSTSERGMPSVVVW